MTFARIAIACLLLVACFLLRAPLESDPVTHVLVQLPALALSGAVLVSRLAPSTGEWNRGGIAAILIFLFATAFWMLPRSIDQALENQFMEAAKFVTVPLLIGAPLALSWPRAHPLLRGFLKAQALSMLLVLAFLYTHAPFRICNSYLASDQVRLGYGFLFVALALALHWVVPLFLAPPNTKHPIFDSAGAQ